MPSSKKHIGFFLLCLIALPSVFSILSASHLQWIKHEMKEKLESGNLQTITIPTDEIVWYEKGQEVLVDGVLFDVKNSVTNGSYTTFQGIFDKEESKLSVTADSMIENTSNNKQLAQIGIYFQQILFNSSLPKYDLVSRSIQKDLSGSYLYSYVSHIPSIPNPPPNLCFS